MRKETTTNYVFHLFKLIIYERVGKILIGNYCQCIRLPSDLSDFFFNNELLCCILPFNLSCKIKINYGRLSLSRNRRDPLKHFEISVLRHIRFVVLRKKIFEQPHFTNDYVI